MSILQTQYAAFARYNRWMKKRLYALAQAVGEGPRQRDLGAFFGSIRRTLGHVFKQLRHDPGVTDLVAMLRDESAP